jgi:hypothetical protein
MPNPFITFQEQQPFMPTTQATGYGNQAALQQMNQLASQAGQFVGGGMGGMNPQALAAMLRKGGGTQLSNAQKAEISQLGSSATNPFSGYNMGNMGFGNYGE